MDCDCGRCTDAAAEMSSYRQGEWDARNCFAPARLDCRSYADGYAAIRPVAQATRISESEYRRRVIVLCPRCGYLLEREHCPVCAPPLSPSPPAPLPYQPHPVWPGGIMYDQRRITFDVVSVVSDAEDDDAEQEP